ncbi:MAG TPA: HDOD domain-containing protein [Polyangiaceae bacterium]|nr:HDOD domain-containing protein [Polyangiaceae bacterium]
MNESLITSALRERLIAVFEDPSYRPPPLPSVAMELLALSNKSDARASDVVRLLEQDEMLAASVMRIVSSPIYSGRNTVTSLKEAVVRLGFKIIRDMVFEVALRSGVFDLAEYAETVAQVQRHSTVTAYLARIICTKARIDGDHAFICGLLHDAGFAGLLFAITHFEGSESPPLGQIWTDVDALHERASGILARLWGLPDKMAEVVGHHHHLHTGEFSKVAAAICIADRLSRSFGADVVGPVDEHGVAIAGDAVSDLDFEIARGELGLSEHTLDEVQSEAEQLVPQILWL